MEENGNRPSITVSTVSTAPAAFNVWEGLGVFLALLAAAYFLALRIRGGYPPAGDEGSWMSVASEVARGQGYSTRWLEGHFLTPYTLPRPDDFRYPVLTSLLALAFGIWGQSVETARWTVAGVFLAFAFSSWLVCRSAFGRWAAMAGLWIMVTSPLQLEWNSGVYTEGAFGLAFTGLAAWCLLGARPEDRPREKSGGPAGPGDAIGLHSPLWWAGLGCGVGLLYLVRVNGILFLPGVFWLFWRTRKQGLSWKHPAWALAAFVLTASPWLIRTGIHFGSPFHIAGSGGLLREAGQSHTLSLAQYLSQHDFLFPIRRMVLGLFRFFQALRGYELGLETVPLLLAGSALILRRRFPGPFLARHLLARHLPASHFLAAGLALSFAASVYASYNSWAGARYMSGMLPFVYAYGLSLVPSLAAAKPALRLLKKVRARMNGLRIPLSPSLHLAAVLGIALLLAPVLQPHRFYQRKFSQRIATLGVYPYRADLTGHLGILETRLPPGGRYFAGTLCNVNFLSGSGHCIALQELYDPTWFPRSMAAFEPELIALTHAETREAPMLDALDRMRAGGYIQDTLETTALGVYLTLRPAGSARAGAQTPIHGFQKQGR